jgi:hypothetical protein
LCNTYESSFEIKSSHRDTYNRQYQTFSQKPGESLDDWFARFESIISNLRSCGPLAYSDNERAKQLLYALDDSVWGMKITVLEESADFATLDTKKLFSKLKSRELTLPRWFPDRAHQMFDEMSVRIYISIFYLILSSVSLLSLLPRVVFLLRFLTRFRGPIAFT